MDSTQGPAVKARRRVSGFGWAGRWKALEAKQAGALEARLSRLDAKTGSLILPEILCPFPQPRVKSFPFGRLIAGIIKVILAIPFWYLLTTSVLICLYRTVDPPATVLMAYREWRYHWKIEAPRPVRIAKFPRYVKSMLVSIEDDKFYVHHGIDLEAMERARMLDKKLGKPMYGGSTLTMQVARTLFLVPEKSYIRKAFEIVTALELETFLSKSRILELYFGYAEWGKGLFGMESASRKYYGAGVASLSRDQAARLIALLSSPIKYNPQTLHRSLILRERYAYLAENYNPPEGEPVTEAAAAAVQPGAAPASASGSLSPQATIAPASAAAAGAATASPPPPSPEPGEDVDSVAPAAAASPPP